MNVNATTTALRSTAGAVLGRVDGLFNVQGACYRGTLVIDPGAVTPGSTKLLQPGQRREALVRMGNPGGGTQAIRSVSVKLPDAYGPGRDQDFLLASSGDGAPLHHFTLPVSETSPTLYSSLWLYLAGLTPVLFGLQTEAGELRPGGVASFTISPPVGKFRSIGTLSVSDQVHEGDDPVFSARNSGGNIRPLPPVSFY